MPVPPKTSLPMTTPKLMPSATCHSGVVAGRIAAYKSEVTKKPSLTSWLRTPANRTSQNPPAAIVTT